MRLLCAAAARPSIDTHPLCLHHPAQPSLSSLIAAPQQGAAAGGGMAHQPWVEK
jgi:hypothetical protein